MRRYLREHAVGLTVLAALALARAAWTPSRRACLGMTMTTCWAAAVALVATGSLIAVAGSAVWLGARASRALRTMPTVPVPAQLADAARRAEVRRLRCIEGGAVTAFCAGYWRPRVFFSVDAAAALAPDALGAVLAHEAAHARRRDPLRRLLWYACTKTLVHLPLAGWWSERAGENAELAADRVAIARAGRGAVARAMMATDTGRAGRAEGRGGVAAMTGFDGAGEARVAQLLGDPRPVRRPPAWTVLISLAALVLVVSLAMCAAQSLWADFAG
jgi:beta-lactamase regulating signal transducer with metallopeptidase domain